MVSNLVKVVLVTGTCFSEGCQRFDGRNSNTNATQVNIGDRAIGSFSQYSSGLLHDD